MFFHPLIIHDDSKCVRYFLSCSLVTNGDCLYYTLYSVIFNDPFHMFQAIQVQRVTAAEDYDEIPRKFMYHFPPYYVPAKV